MPRLPILLSALATVVLAGAVRADDWPQWLGPRRDGVWRETGLLEKFPEGGLPVRWRTPLALGYAGPAVADGKVYVTDWKPNDGVRVPPSGFSNVSLPGRERVHCLDEKTGKIVWTHDYPCTYQLGFPGGPRTTPLVHQGKVYTLGTMGHLLCLDIDKGAVLWSKDLHKEYSAPVQTWGFSASPLIDGDRLICLVGGDATAVAFHKDTGKELWRSLQAPAAGYCPPVIYTVGKTRQLIIWHPSAIESLNPETGKVYWTQPFTARAALSIPMPRLAGNHLLVTSFYNGSILLKLDEDKPAATVVWKGKSSSEQPRLTDGLHSIMPTPYIKDGYIYGVCSYGQLRCLEEATGKRVWDTFKATSGKEERWANAFLIPHGDAAERTFLFNDQGDLILARLTPKGYDEIGRAHVIEPTNTMANNRPVVWVHPAFANRSVYVRNDKEIVCVSVAAK